MSDELKREIIRACAFGEPVECIAAAYGLTLDEVAEVCEAQAAEIAARREEMRAAGLFAGEKENA